MYLLVRVSLGLVPCLTHHKLVLYLVHGLSNHIYDVLRT